MRHRTHRPAALVTRSTTHVMSCDASVVVVGGAAGQGDRAVERLHQLERRWSRFLSDSDVSLLNRAGGQPLVVSPDTIRLVEAMVEAWHLTDGAFDPTLLRSVVEAGYGTSRVDRAHTTTLGADIDTKGRPAEIRLDRVAAVVELPVGTAIDPGGIGKGLAADIVVEELIACGAAGALVEIGGDLAVRGRAPDETGWMIAVAERPEATSEPVMVQLVDGGVATSTTSRRRWISNGEERHHLIDPSTLECSTTPVRTSTIIAGSAASAEAFTKVAFGDAPTDALLFLDQHGLAGRFQLRNGSVRTSNAWNRFALPTGPTPTAMASAATADRHP